VWRRGSIHSAENSHTASRRNPWNREAAKACRGSCSRLRGPCSWRRGPGHARRGSESCFAGRITEIPGRVRGAPPFVRDVAVSRRALRTRLHRIPVPAADSGFARLISRSKAVESRSRDGGARPGRGGRSGFRLSRWGTAPGRPSGPHGSRHNGIREEACRGCHVLDSFSGLQPSVSEPQHLVMPETSGATAMQLRRPFACPMSSSAHFTPVYLHFLISPRAISGSTNWP
jgi:hypothetical protein